jgi:hypothetical protein
MIYCVHKLCRWPTLALWVIRHARMAVCTTGTTCFAVIGKQLANSLPSVTLDKEVSTNCTSAMASLLSTFCWESATGYSAKKSRCHGAK